MSAERCLRVPRKKSNTRDKYLGKIIGGFKLVEVVEPRPRIMVFWGVCTKCKTKQKVSFRGFTVEFTKCKQCKFNNIIGKTYGKLTVDKVESVITENRQGLLCTCTCECGETGIKKWHSTLIDRRHCHADEHWKVRY